MDTGAIAIKITTDANLPIEKTQEVMEQINKLMYAHDKEKLEIGLFFRSLSLWVVIHRRFLLL